MHILCRLIVVVALFTMASLSWAQLPTPEQVGIYSCKATMTSNFDLENPKLIKQPAVVLVTVAADGTCTLQISTEGGAPGMGSGDGVFGSAAGLIRIAIDSIVATGRVAFKGTGTKTSISGNFRLLVAGNFYSLGDITLKGKKLII